MKTVNVLKRTEGTTHFETKFQEGERRIKSKYQEAKNEESKNKWKNWRLRRSETNQLKKERMRAQRKRLNKIL